MLRPRKPAHLGWISDGDVHEYMRSALANERKGWARDGNEERECNGQ